MLGLNSEILARGPSLLKQGIAGRKGGESTEVAIRCPQFLNAMMLTKGGNAGNKQVLYGAKMFGSARIC